MFGGSWPACGALPRLDARRHAGRRAHRRPRGARERRLRRVAQDHPPELPLARRTRQPVDLGRPAHRAAAARAGRARDAHRPRARADPTGALPALARPRRGASRLVLGAERPTTPGDVAPRRGTPLLELPEWVEPGASFEQVANAGHAEGYAVVAGAIEWKGGFAHPRPRALEAYEPGSGRIPGFTHALVCPSVLDGVALERVDDVAGLPAFAAPADEPWIYDGRAVLEAHPSRRTTARPQSGRRAS